MCSIFAILEIERDAGSLRERALQMSKLQRHRGPDWSGVFVGEHAVLAHERLAIVDVEHGAQPLVSADGRHVLAVNGEIYNHQELRRRYPDYPFQTNSDCEVILALYQAKGASFLNELSGIFAFVLYDLEQNRYLIGRDPIGVVPLYTGRDGAGHLRVASEMKALLPDCAEVTDFPPGHRLDSEIGVLQQYYAPTWRSYGATERRSCDAAALRRGLESAVERQLMADVPFGCLLSGGLDSSIIAALAQRQVAMRDGMKQPASARLHTFAIGLRDSPDLVKAKIAASSIGTLHHEVVYDFQEGLDAIPSVIHHIETYDVTTVRASTPMFLLARRIRALGIKMVLTGEGADEVFGGYLYFHKAPHARAFHEECVRKLDALHKFDCLRANKSLAAWGVEARVPFLDRDFLDVAMAFDAADKMCSSGRIEKHALRAAFAELLPAEIAWRQKEQFSDGVGYGWIDGLKAYANRRVSDDDFARAPERFPYNTPLTKEAYFYREIFAGLFPGEAPAALVPAGKSIACSTPTALEWDAGFAACADPSGRSVREIHHHGSRDAQRRPGGGGGAAL